MDKICPHKNHRQRLKKQISDFGLDSLSEIQIVEYLLTYVMRQGDTNLTAHRLLDEFGSFHGILEADFQALQRVDGVGECTAFFINELLPLFRYYKKNKSSKHNFIKNTKKAIFFFNELLGDRLTEELYLVTLSVNNRINKITKLSCGNFSKLTLSVKGIHKHLSGEGDAKFIVGHNHPGGVARPSMEDIATTEYFREIGRVTGVEFLDHIIIAEDSAYSFNNYKEYSIEELYE